MTEQTETMDPPLDQPVRATDTRAAAPYAQARSDRTVSPQAGTGTCSSCGGDAGMNGDAGTTTYVYAIGRVEARFPNLAAEKEFAQATGRTETAGKTDQQAFHAVLSQRQNRYLVRQLCWVLTIQGMETYRKLPPLRDKQEVELSGRILPGGSHEEIEIYG
ncbi:MAG: hypothetical protein ABI270_10525, partial [Nitrosospira sp.]